MTDHQGPQHRRDRPDGAAHGTGTSLRHAQAVVAAAALLSAGVYGLLWDAPGWTRLVLIAASAAAVVGRSVVVVGAVLILAWGGELLLDAVALTADDRLDVGDVVSALALAAFLVCALRHVELHRVPLAPPVLSFRDIEKERHWRSQWHPRRPASSPPALVPRQPPALRLRPLSGAGLRVALASVLSLALLGLVPVHALAGNTAKLIPAAYRAIILFWVLAGVALVLATAFSVQAWRRLSPRQASLSIRRVLADELRREQAVVERARVRRARQPTAGS